MNEEQEATHTTETLEFRERTDKKLVEIESKKSITVLNWVTILGIVAAIIVALLGGFLYIVRAENAPIKKDSEAIKRQLIEVKEDVNEVKEEVKEVKKELKEVSKRVKTEVEFERLAKAKGREACIEYHLIRDRK